MKPLFLIGLPGSGKSTLGKALGSATGLEFIDLDKYIECRFHANVRDIFAHEGEETFRRREKAMLREAGEFTDVIIACGGGTPCFFDNMDYMLQAGTVVWLTADEQRIYSRLLAARHKRPAIAARSDAEVLSYLRTLTALRSPHYGRAHLTFDSSKLDSRDQIDCSVRRFLQLFPELPLTSAHTQI